MTEITVYVEGGGNTAGQKAELRQGFDALFVNEKSKAREKRGSLRFVCCGGRQQAYDAFINALNVNQGGINALLVDSETAVPPVPADEVKDAVIRVAHLQAKGGTEGRGQGDGWGFAGVVSNRIHLMVQCMEAWIVADPDALQEFYHQDFKRDALPKQPNLENASKKDIYERLRHATENTQKGEYGKIKHASKLLVLISPDRVSLRCPRFRIFRDWLSGSI
jgi:hypothetical protein